MYQCKADISLSKNWPVLYYNYHNAACLTTLCSLINTRFPAARIELILYLAHPFFNQISMQGNVLSSSSNLALNVCDDLNIQLKETHLHALAVIEEHVAEFFGHHVQVSLLALVGPGQNIELGEVGRQIIERSRENTKPKRIVLLHQNHSHV